MDYFKKHTDINSEMRMILLDWLLEVRCEYETSFNSYNLAVILFDIYLSKTTKICPRNKFQCVGVCCFNIAAKILDGKQIGIEEYQYISAKTYSIKEMLTFEREIIETLDFNIEYPTLMESIEKYCENNKFCPTKNKIMKFLAVISLTNIYYLSIPFNLLVNKIEILSEFIMNSNHNLNSSLNGDKIIIYLSTQLQKNLSNKYEGLYNLADNLNVSINILKSRVSELFDNLQPTNFIFDLNSLKMMYNLNCKYIYKPCIKYTFNDLTNSKYLTELGQGSFGSVVLKEINGEKIAVKTQRDFDSYTEITTEMIREMISLRTLCHENIIKLHGYHYSDNFFILGFQPMTCTLKKYLSTNKISDNIKFCYIDQLLSGLKYMHYNGIMHRDLHCDNILISLDGKLKIADLGSSRRISDHCKLIQYSTTICSLEYRAIEILLGVETYTEKIDIWSCACIIGEILGFKLFQAENEIMMVENILKKLGTSDKLYNWPNWSYWSQRRNWDKINLYPRKGFTEIESNYNNHAKIIYKMLEYNPEMRISAHDALIKFSKLKN
ncbi:cyclin domain fused to cyclin-dependent serine/threonine protein kinase [Cotonvirus japonicus]|uniref:cyclin-dependent kinase n=1 Tax=Cotonvirus japonicus TaxID=2811091 RepID=A0ABM7NTT4_9VIRU|nr:cyclin domain fused to cyclin-dependent serine/threonine protein kinase [Cotonvirus japonicus]BCS83511.1 cyclin domain fused to cyclin-dependent serine/threonine protein kinase [Cotonvirus japonicus]